MKRNILILFLMSLSLTGIQAQLLWKISGNGIKHPSYLFGTHNLIPIQFLDSVPGLFKAYNACDVVVGEMVLNNIDATAKIQQAAIMPEHGIINDLLNEDECKLVDGELKSVLKLSLKDVSRMNPSFIITLYKTEIYKKITGFTDDKQSDSYFQQVAIEEGKKVVGLETVDKEIGFLYGNGNLEHQADNLVETIQHKQNILDKMILLSKLYKAGKIDELVELSKDKENLTNMTDEEFLKLVDNRNTAWKEKLPNLLNNSSCFIALDAVHIGGKSGLINQLKKAGYKVTEVNK